METRKQESMTICTTWSGKPGAKEFLTVSVWSGWISLIFNNGVKGSPMNKILLNLSQAGALSKFLQVLVAHRGNIRKSDNPTSMFHITRYPELQPISFDCSYTDNTGTDKNTGNIVIGTENIGDINNRVIFRFLNGEINIPIALTNVNVGRFIKNVTFEPNLFTSYDVYDEPLYQLSYIFSRIPLIMQQYAFVQKVSYMLKSGGNSDNNSFQKQETIASSDSSLF